MQSYAEPPEMRDPEDSEDFARLVRGIGLLRLSELLARMPLEL